MRGAQTERMTLVLLPGLDGTAVFFEPLLAALPQGVRPLVVTYPQSTNHGYAELLALVRERLAGVSECWVLGWSFSGPLALMLAMAEPHKVRGVILSATFVRTPNPILRRLRHVLCAPTVLTWRIARRLPLWLFRPRTDPMRRAKNETLRMIPSGVLAARLRAILVVDARDPLRACPQPVLYIASSRDGIVPPRNLHEIRQLRPSVQVAVIDGPHQAMYTNPDAAAAAIEQFIGGTGTPGTAA
jgi:pimeloyl-ACP methyl ester carboxylesterase